MSTMHALWAVLLIASGVAHVLLFSIYIKEPKVRLLIAGVLTALIADVSFVGIMDGWDAAPVVDSMNYGGWRHE